MVVVAIGCVVPLSRIDVVVLLASFRLVVMWCRRRLCLVVAIVVHVGRPCHCVVVACVGRALVLRLAVAGRYTVSSVL